MSSSLAWENLQLLMFWYIHKGKIMADDDHLDRIDILPDCRSREGRGAKATRTIPGVGWMVPVYCANCGCEAGFATETESLTFIFVLCDTCGRESGIIEASHALTPDEALWRYTKQEQIDVHGRELTPKELRKVVDSDSSPLATLLTKGR